MEDGEKKEAFVMPVFSRSQGILAVPVDFLPREVLEEGQAARSTEVVGPTKLVKCPGVQESENGEEVPIGVEISCLLVDFSTEIMPHLGEFDAVTDTSDIQHFWPELQETLPLPGSLLEQALDRISKEPDTRVHYYSAVEEEAAPGKFCGSQCKEGSGQAEEDDQLALLTESIPVLTQQMEKLRAD